MISELLLKRATRLKFSWHYQLTKKNINEEGRFLA